MWNKVVPAMLAVDPSLRFVGPGTAGGQFGSRSAVGNEYITRLMDGATVKPYAISFHGYGYWDNTVSDKWILDGDNTGAGGIPDFVGTAQRVHNLYPTGPIWITEINVNADWGEDTNNRPWNVRRRVVGVGLNQSLRRTSPSSISTTSSTSRSSGSSTTRPASRSRTGS